MAELVTRKTSSFPTNNRKTKVRVPISINITRTWEPKGTVTSIRVKKRIKSQKELDREELERQQRTQKARPPDYQLRELGCLPSSLFRNDESNERNEALLLNHIEKRLDGLVPPVPSIRDLAIAKKKDAAASSVVPPLSARRKGNATSTAGTAIPASSRPKRLKNENNPHRLKKKPPPKNAIQYRPKWLSELTLPALIRARKARLVRNKVVRLQRHCAAASDDDETGNVVADDARHELKMLLESNKLVNAVPPLRYDLWSAHVSVVVADGVEEGSMKRKSGASSVVVDTTSIGSNKTKIDDYFRYDALGWIKGKGYVRALRSPAAEANMNRLFEVLNDFLTPSNRDDDKDRQNVNPPNKTTDRDHCGLVKVLELGSGGGQHAVTFCERRRGDLVWQPSDVSQICVDSVDNRADYYGVLLPYNWTDYPRTATTTPATKATGALRGSTGCLKCIKLNVLTLQKTLETIPHAWKTSVDVMTVINVIPYTPWLFTINMWKLARCTVAKNGFVFLYGLFRMEEDDDERRQGQTTTSDDDRYGSDLRGASAEQGAGGGGGDRLARRREILEKMDVRLRTMSPAFGVRRLEDVIAVAKENGFDLEMKFDMDETGNLGLFFRNVGDSAAAHEEKGDDDDNLGDI